MATVIESHGENECRATTRKFAEKDKVEEERANNSKSKKAGIRNYSNEAFRWTVSSIIYRIWVKSLLIYKQWIGTQCDSISSRNAPPHTFTNRQVKLCWVRHKWTKIIDNVFVYIVIFFNNTLWNNGLAAADFRLWIVIFVYNNSPNRTCSSVHIHSIHEWRQNLDVSYSSRV